MLPLVAKADDITSEFTKCATTKNDKARLACYDGISANFFKESDAQTKRYDGYKLTDLADLKVDIATLNGKKIAVSSYIQTVGDTSMLKGDPMDMSPVFAVTSKLARDDRKKLLSACQSDLCRGTFYGVIKQGDLGPALFLDKVVWQ